MGRWVLAVQTLDKRPAKAGPPEADVRCAPRTSPENVRKRTGGSIDNIGPAPAEVKMLAAELDAALTRRTRPRDTHEILPQDCVRAS